MRNVIVKASWQRNRRDGGRVRRDTLVAAQVCIGSEFLAVLAGRGDRRRAPAVTAQAPGGIRGRLDIRRSKARRAAARRRRAGRARGRAIFPTCAAAWSISKPRRAARSRARVRPRDHGSAQRAFVPHVLAVMVGTMVDFPNSDMTYHNVFSLSQAKRFDLGRYAAGKSKSVRFDRPGVVRVFCDIHSHMNAFVLVFSHPFFDVTDVEGRFQLRRCRRARIRWSAGTRARHASRDRWSSRRPAGRKSIWSSRNARALLDHQPHFPGQHAAGDALDRRGGVSSSAAAAAQRDAKPSCSAI